MTNEPKMRTLWNRCAEFTPRRRALPRGLLLSNAVDSAAAPKQVVERDLHHCPARVGAPQRLGRRGILGNPVGRSDDRAVGNIEVHIGPAVALLPARYRSEEH